MDFFPFIFFCKKHYKRLLLFIVLLHSLKSYGQVEYFHADSVMVLPLAKSKAKMGRFPCNYIFNYDSTKKLFSIHNGKVQLNYRIIKTSVKLDDTDYQKKIYNQAIDAYGNNCIVNFLFHNDSLLPINVVLVDNDKWAYYDLTRISFDDMKNSIEVDKEWVLLGTSMAKDTFYYRSSYVTRDENRIKIWVKMLINKLTVKPPNYSSETLFEFDCNNKTYRIIQSNTFNNKHTLVKFNSIDDPRWEDIVPDSILEVLSEKVCELFKK